MTRIILATTLCVCLPAAAMAASPQCAPIDKTIPSSCSGSVVSARIVFGTPGMPDFQYAGSAFQDVGFPPPAGVSSWIGFNKAYDETWLECHASYRYSILALSAFGIRTMSTAIAVDGQLVAIGQTAVEPSIAEEATITSLNQVSAGPHSLAIQGSYPNGLFSGQGVWNVSTMRIDCREIWLNLQ